MNENALQLHPIAKNNKVLYNTELQLVRTKVHFTCKQLHLQYTDGQVVLNIMLSSTTNYNLSTDTSFMELLHIITRYLLHTKRQLLVSKKLHNRFLLCFISITAQNKLELHEGIS